eukprot:CAMPEP_0119004690 /NCGR_PEP_ID=MMETSP1176-20130426/1296_1 /TAXON_ID=265551 /ORGANISM="Synedropsis recta cf, Strain CCMP1620" /LENGTH=142 /DNA_ID=CAMNT_0006956425 /DNA_START=217 /DNA_END=645 /DNA_ORIENTATION=-
MVRAAHERSTSFYIACTAWFVAVVTLCYLDLGVIAFVGSALLGIWNFGLREKFASDDAASAYSVFNRNNKAIPGGFTAQQFERQMRGTAGGAMDDPDDGATGMAAASIATTEIPTKIGDAEKLRRRKAAASAAEKRFAQKNQ